MMSAPLIGITTERRYNAHGFPLIGVLESYIQAVVRSGGCPVLIPIGLPEAVLGDLVPRLSGVLFTGGGDVHPERYGSTPHPRVSGVDPDRDRVEIELLQAAVARGTPFLGICRGLQVINVALGGSLYEDLVDQRPGSDRHDQFPEHPRDYLAHPVQIDDASRLRQVVRAACLEVNSLHHQGIRRLAERLQATAWAPDGLIEAVELHGYPFGLAVQWHPESLLEHAPMRALFESFLESCVGHPRPDSDHGGA